MDLDDLHRLRQRLLDEKDYLAQMYTSSSEGKKKDVRHYILYATTPQLQVLVCILHKIAARKIAIPKKYKHKLARSSKEHFLDELKTTHGVHDMLTRPRREITTYLCKFIPLYAAFLYYLFHLT